MPHTTETVLRRSSPKSIKRDLVIIALLFAAILISIFAYFSYRIYEFHLEKASLILKQEAARIENAFHYSFASTRDTMEQLNKHILDEKLSPVEIEQLFRTFKIEDKTQNILAWNMFSWVNPDQLLTVNSKRGALPTPINVSSREYVQKMIENPWRIIVSSVPLIGMVSGQYIITCGMGATDDNHRFAGGMVIGSALDGINDRIQKLIQSPAIDFALISSKNQIVMESFRKNDWVLNNSLLRKIERMRQKKVTKGILFLPQSLYLTAEYPFFQLPYSDYTLVIRYNPQIAQQELMQSLLPRLLETALVMASIPLFFLWGKRKIITPIFTLSGLAQQISSGHIPKEFPIFSTIELQDLSDQLQYVIHYIEDKNTLEEQLLHKTEIANNAVEAKSDFMSCITHELRTPLNAILGYASIQTKELYGPLGHEKYYDYVNDIQAAGKHLLGLIDTILDYIRADEGAVQLRYEEIDMVKMLQEAITIALDIIEEKKINITIEADNHIPFLISDRFRLKQVIINILSNAIKFMEINRQIVISLKLYRDEMTKIRHLLVLITDSGNGIREEDIDRMLKPFSQAESGLSRRFGGIGLGLPLSQKLIEILGGTLVVDSIHGSGTTVIMRFPENLISPHRRFYHT